MKRVLDFFKVNFPKVVVPFVASVAVFSFIFGIIIGGFFLSDLFK